MLVTHRDGSKLTVRTIAVADREDVRGEPTIADVLTGRTHVTPLLKITAGQRLHYNYRFDQPSLEREIANVAANRRSRELGLDAETVKEG